MDWILNHLQIVVAVAAAIAYWFNQQKAAAREDDDKPAPESRPFEQARTDGTDDERTRRIQEEIRRKIAERRGVAPQPTSAPAPVAQPVAPPVIAPRPVAREMMGGLRERLEAKLAEARAKAEAVVQERQRRQEEETRMQEAERLAVQRRVAESTALTTAASGMVAEVESKAAKGEVRTWPEELRDPRSMRRAMLLREILGPPVGLR